MKPEVKQSLLTLPHVGVYCHIQFESWNFGERFVSTRGEVFVSCAGHGVPQGNCLHSGVKEASGSNCLTLQGRNGTGQRHVVSSLNTQVSADPGQGQN